MSDRDLMDLSETVNNHIAKGMAALTVAELDDVLEFFHRLRPHLGPNHPVPGGHTVDEGIAMFEQERERRRGLEGDMVAPRPPFLAGTH